MIIGLLGTPIESSNLGCMALTYSLIIELEKISKELHEDMRYIIFDGSENESAIVSICKDLELDRYKIISGHMSLLYNPFRVIKNLKNTIRMISEIKKCDLIIDITGGDSFSDIYGKVIFRGRTNVKRLVEMMKKPLMLAPQTYGPFIRKDSKRAAIKVIQNASCVMTRDTISQEYVKDLCGTEPILTTDLAFLLPYEKCTRQNKKKYIGINVSSLLFSNEKLEVNSKDFELKANYKEFILFILDTLTKNENNQVYLIPHVGIDHDIHKLLKKQFSNVILVEPTNNPIEMKSIISKMDVFIGSRMHGTIAAFSTGVACIPVAYSRKFGGLFGTLGYHYIIDLQTMDEREAAKTTLKYVEEYEGLLLCINKCMDVTNKYVTSLEKTMKDWIISNKC